MDELFDYKQEPITDYKIFLSKPLSNLIDKSSIYSVMLDFAKEIDVVDTKYNKQHNAMQELQKYKINLIFGRSVTQKLFGNKTRLKLEFQIFKHATLDIYYIFLPDIDQIINRKVSIYPIQFLNFIKRFLKHYREKKFVLYSPIKFQTKHAFSLIAVTTREQIQELNSVIIKTNVENDFIEELEKNIQKEKIISLDIETPSTIVGNGLLSISLYLPSIHTAYVIVKRFDKYKEFFRKLFFRWDTKIIQHNLKFDLKYLFHHYGFTLPTLNNDEFNLIWNKNNPKFFDTLLIPAIINTGSYSLSLKGWAGYFYFAPAWHLFDNEEITTNLTEIPIEKIIKYNAYDAFYSYKIFTKWKHLLYHSRYQNLIYPMFLLTLFAEVEGVTFNMNLLHKINNNYNKELNLLREHIKKISDGLINNPLSAKDLKEWVVKNNLTKFISRTAKGNLSLKKDSIEKAYNNSKISAKYKEVLRLVLLYRTLQHQQATYFDPEKYTHLISRDGRVHTTFRMLQTYSGRLSSENPNIQQVGKRISVSEYIKKEEEYLKELFIANKLYISSDGYKIVEIDLSQAEVRWLAVVSQDPQLLKIYIDDIDIYREYGGYSLDKKPEEITKEERQMFKRVVLSIQYGTGAKGLAQQLKCSDKKAQKLLDDYFSLFKFVKKFRQKMLYVKPNEKEFIYLPVPTRTKLELICKQTNKLSIANFPIQALSSDFNLVVFYYFMKYLREKYSYLVPYIRIINYVHDAGYFEVKEQYVDKFVKILENFYANLYDNMGDFMSFLFVGLQRFYKYIYKENKRVFILPPMKGEVEVGLHF